MPMTIHAIPCPPPILQSDFDACRVPGGIELWSNGGFYSPGGCFDGYRALCTQTSPASNGWPIRGEETVVRCVPDGYTCNDMARDQKYAVTNYDGTTLSAPAFEIRWRSADLTHAIRTTERFPPGLPTPFSTSTSDFSTSTPIITSTTNIFVTTPASSLLASSSLAISSTIAQSSLSNVPSSPPAKSHLASSPGAIAGITVGGGLGLLVVASAIMFLYLHRRRKYQGPSRLTDDTWGQGGAQKELTDLTGSHCPVELEDKPMELRELPVEPQPCAEQLSYTPRACHISVNTIPVEAAADLAHGTQAIERST
ncbi:hypothetical protein V8C42DRAFT_323982 [Trichoderma barbatum]